MELLLTAVAGLYLAVSALWVVDQTESLGADIVLLRSAGERLLAGEAIYPDPSGGAFATVDPTSFYGPPALAVLSVPLTLLSDGALRLLAFPVSWTVFAAGLAVMSIVAGLRRNQIAAIFVGAIGCFAIFGGATLGASSVWLFGLLAGAAYAIARDRNTLAGVLLGTAAALRVYPVVLLVTLAVAGRWRALVVALAAVVGWGVIGLIVAGPDQTGQYIQLLLGLSGVEGGTSDLAFHGLLRVASIATGGALIVWSGRLIAAAETPAARVLAFGLACAGMLLTAPVVWDHYLTALLPLVVGVAATLGAAWPGLLSVGFTTAALAGAYAIVWAPIVGVVAVMRSRRVG